MDEDRITLKWGTLKSWNCVSDEMIKLAKRYCEIGFVYSAMAQRDTPEQKEIICKMIDIVPGEIYLDWDGEYVSKEKAKEYVMNHGK